MKVIVEGCPHKWVDLRAFVVETGVALGTCTSCYLRLRSDGRYDTLAQDKRWILDFAPPPCDHDHKKAVAEQVTRRLPYRDAICTDCGVVLRHPDAPGEWVEVIFNGHLVEEVP